VSSSLFRFASPAGFYPIAGIIAKFSYFVAIVLCVWGLWKGLVMAPTDFQQGDAYRIIYIHVPSAWMSMFIYVVMACYSALYLVFNTRLSAMMAQALAPTGAFMTIMALWTGAFWGKPTWGTYWVWDARNTSEFVLLFIYLGFIALRQSIEDERKADKIASIACIIGVVNIPIIYFSVKWWNTLHQGATITREGAKMQPEMLWALLIMTFAFWAYCIGASLTRVRAIMLEREAHATWAQQVARS
jgi:heme exporter protein C